MNRTQKRHQSSKWTLIILLLLALSPSAYAQKIGLKTNTLYWATTTPNAGIEMAINKKWSVDLSGGLNLWKYDHNRKFRHWAVLPEVRYWTCESFNGSFIGIHGLVSHFNINDIDLPVGRLKDLNDHRFQGWGYGAGLTYGYQFVLGLNWNLELSLSGGYIYFDYSKYKCATCGRLLEKASNHYMGVTKATLSIIYIIK